jgi:hypothetical protein
MEVKPRYIPEQAAGAHPGAAAGIPARESQH